MDTKISSTFWSDPDIEAATAETKFTALWLLTNARIDLCGHAQVTPERFAFETKAPPEGLGRAMVALPRGFLSVGKGYWARNFIGYQFGRGNTLARSCMRFPITEALRLLSKEVQALVLAEYPELQEAFDKVCFKALPIPPYSPPVGVREGEGVGEGVGVGERAGERVRAGEGAGDDQSASDLDQSQPGSTPQKKKRGARAGFVSPSDQTPALASRMLAVGGLKRRQEGTAWSPAEFEAFKAARLDSLSSEDFAGQVETLRGYYLATIPRAQDYRRRDLATLLNNWPGEIDRAREWNRANGDGLKRL